MTTGCMFSKPAAVLSPASTTVYSAGSQQFSVRNLPGQTIWAVNGLIGGSADVGTISSTGAYSAPQVVLLTPVTVTATSSTMGLSLSASVELRNQAPHISTANPAIFPAGCGAVPVTISGSNFSPASRLVVDGVAQATSYVSASELRTSIEKPPAASVQPISVTVENPSPGGGTDTLALPELSPAAASIQTYQQQQFNVSQLPGGAVWMVNGIVGGSAVVGTITTTGIYSPPNVAPNTAVTISVVSARDSSLAGSASISVLNPVPTISRLSPRVAATGAAPFTLTIDGDNFVPGATLNVAGTVVAADFHSKTQLTATIPPIASGLDSVPLYVTNPGPGGGSSLSTDISLIHSAVAATAHPLVAEYDITVPVDATVSVDFGPDTNYGHSTWAKPVPAGGGTLKMLVAGMKAQSTYHMQARVQLANGDVVSDADHTFVTGPLPVPVSYVRVSMDHPFTSGLELPDNLSNVLFALDRDGSVVWYYTDPAQPKGDIFPGDPLPNGDFLLNFYLTDVREVDLTGKIVRQITMDQLRTAVAATGSPMVPSAVHHHVLELPNGDWMLLVQETQKVALAGIGTRSVTGDALIEVDLSGKVVWLWRAFDHLDVNRHPYSTSDWTHANAIVYTPDGNLLLSMRHQNWIIKIDYADGHGSGDVLWRLGAEGDFVLSGGDPAEWFYGQHYPNRLSSDPWRYDLAVFDNGNQRPGPDGQSCAVTGGCYTRAVIFAIDEVSRTATVKWEYRPGWYASWGGSIVQLPNGDIEFDSSTVDGGPSKVVEVTSDANPHPVWTLSSTNNYYRSFRIPSLYPGVQW